LTGTSEGLEVAITDPEDLSGEPAESWAMSEAVTVAIVNFNGRGTLANTVESVLNMDYPILELLIIDDESTDGSIEEIERLYPDLQTLRMGRNTGMPNRLRNIGIRSSETRYVLVSDNDVTFDRHCLRNLFAAIRSLPHAALCTPRILLASEPSKIHSQGHQMHFIGTSIDGSRNKKIDEVPDDPRVSVGCGIQLVDKARINGIGFFDEEFALGWGDDGEFHHRVNMSGLRCYSVPRAIAYHDTPREHSRFYGQIRNRWSMIAQSYSLKTILLLLPAFVLYEIEVFLLLARKGAMSSYFSAARHVLSNRKRILERRRAIQSMRRVGDRDLLHSGPIYIPQHLFQDRLTRVGASLLNRAFAIYWRLVGPAL